MSVLYIMVPAALALAIAALIGFFWAVKDGQYDDVDAERYRLLMDDRQLESQSSKSRDGD